MSIYCSYDTVSVISSQVNVSFNLCHGIWSLIYMWMCIVWDLLKNEYRTMCRFLRYWHRKRVVLLSVAGSMVPQSVALLHTENPAFHCFHAQVLKYVVFFSFQTFISVFFFAKCQFMLSQLQFIWALKAGLERTF